MACDHSSFTYNELLQFYAAAQYENVRTPKDLINLISNRKPNHPPTKGEIAHE